HERRRFVGFAVLRENLLPLCLRASEHGRHELPHLVRRRSRVPRAGTVTRSRIGLLLRTASARQDLGAADQHARVDTQPIADWRAARPLSAVVTLPRHAPTGPSAMGGPPPRPPRPRGLRTRPPPSSPRRSSTLSLRGN